MNGRQFVYHMQGLTKTYPGNRKVLENINLSFYPDAKIGVLGVNGSGKSTLLRIMAGIDTDYVGEGWVAEGARVVGHKVGLSSEAMQKMMNVDEPDYGHLLDEMQVYEDRPVKSANYLYPRVEVEVGFVLADDLPGAGCTEDDVLAATAAFAPSIELIDTRITDWKIKLCDTIADNASSAGWVLGEARVSPKDIDIKTIDAVLTRNGEVAPI